MTGVDRHLVADGACVLVQPVVGEDPVGLAPDVRLQGELRGVRVHGRSRHDGRAARDQEAPDHLAVAGVPHPVADLGVERVVLGAPPRRHAVVQAVEHLAAVLDRPERLEVDVLPVGGETDLSRLVGVGDVLALVALPDAGQAGQRPPLRSCAQRFAPCRRRPGAAVVPGRGRRAPGVVGRHLTEARQRLSDAGRPGRAARASPRAASVAAASGCACVPPRHGAGSVPPRCGWRPAAAARSPPG